MGLNNTHLDSILVDYAAGLPTKHIADYYGVNPHSVRRMASDAKVKHGENARWYNAQVEAMKAEDAAKVASQTAKSEAWGRVFENAAKHIGQPVTATPVSHLIIPDTQCKPGVDLEHMYWAGRYAAERKPDVIVHLGDHWDMPSLSSYEKPGSKYFEGKRYKDDIVAGNDGLLRFEFGLGGWKPKRKVLLRGNHEDRITRAVNADPKLEGVIGFEDFIDKELGWEVIDYLTPVTIDGVAYCHYFYHPNTGRAYAGSVDNMLRNIGYTFTMGHQQGKRIGSRELGNGQTQRGLVVGSFYQHNETYRGPQASGEWRGLIVKHEVAGGNYDIMEVSMNYLKEKYGS
jgi:hypothetical protein